MGFYRVPLLLFRFPKKSHPCLGFISCKNNRCFTTSSIQHDTNSTTAVSCGDDGITTTTTITRSVSLSNNCQWWDRFLSANDTDTFQTIKTDCRVYEDFISVEEENSLLNEIEPYLKRLRYEHDHWDNAIHAYRETERKHWLECNKHILNRIKSVAFESTEVPLPYTHILDIERVGYIKPHVDSVRFCGRTIAGLSLMSPSVMRLALEKDKTKYGDLLLLPRSLYILRDRSRFEFTHELLPEEKSEFKGESVPRDRRISLMQRLTPDKVETPD